MTIRIGINGFGRIGRMIFRTIQKRKNIKVVGINDLSNIKYIAYMLKYDSTHGKFNSKINIKNNNIIINNQYIRYTSEKQINKINWKEIKADIIVESTGIYLNKKDNQKHIISGAKKVIITAPTQDSIPMFVMGVNHNKYNNENIISNSSCTTNCVSVLAKIINDNFGINEALMTTIHSITSTQKTVDSISQKDWRMGRGAYQNIIPSSTGAATSVGKIIPDLNGKITGISFRVPLPNVSVVDLTVKLKKSTSFKNICKVIKLASNSSFKNILGYSEEDVVSSDFNGNSLISIFDAKASIALNKNFVKLIAWYDNEVGYSNKTLDLINYICNY